MGVKERRLRDKIRRSNEIIDAAENIIFSKGIQNSTMDDIAKEAELGKATLYVYYKSKDEILLAIQERACEILASLFKEAIAKHALGYDKIRAIGDAYFYFAREYPNYYKFISLFESIATSIEPEKTLLNVQKVSAVMIEAINSGMKDGTVRNDLRPEVMAKLLWAMSTGVMQMIDVRGKILAEYHQIYADELFDTFFKMLNTGIVR